jgi:hypothetical protein
MSFVSFSLPYVVTPAINVAVVAISDVGAVQSPFNEVLPECCVVENLQQFFFAYMQYGHSRES